MIQSWMVGDGENDVNAGQNTGCRTILIGKGEFGQDMSVNSLLEFAEKGIAWVSPMSSCG